MSALWFALASLVTFLLASGLAVQAAEQVEHAWGRGGSFQLLCVLSLVASLLLLVGFGIGGLVARRFPRRNRASVLGILSACIFMALVWIASAVGADPAQSWPLVFSLPLLGGVAPFLQRKSDA